MEEQKPLDAEELEGVRAMLATYQMLVGWGVLGRFIVMAISGLAAFALVIKQLKGGN